MAVAEFETRAYGDGDDSEVNKLLLRWRELREQGTDVSAQEICTTRPDLAEELARRIEILRRLEPALADTDANDSAAVPAALLASRQAATARAEFHGLRFHAAGGLGEVYVAHNTELNRDVALKFLKPDQSHDEDSLRRFLQEAEVTSRLEHPGVVPIYALGTDADGSPCYAMRFIHGETLQDSLGAFHKAESPGRDPSERSLALRELLTRFVSICSTVGYAHSRGILHRDLKPQNVMLGKIGLAINDQIVRHERDRAERARDRALIAEGLAVKARNDAEVARQEEATARALADTNSAFARKAVDEMFIYVAEDRFPRVPGVVLMRKEIVQRALAYYGDFLKLRPSDRKVRGQTALILERLANIERMTSSSDSALVHYAQAEALYKKLALESPSDETTGDGLAALERDFAEALKMAGRPAEAFPRYALALELARARHDAKPGDGNRERTLASILNDYGLALGEAGRSEEGLPLCDLNGFSRFRDDQAVCVSRPSSTGRASGTQGNSFASVS